MAGEELAAWSRLVTEETAPGRGGAAGEGFLTVLQEERSRIVPPLPRLFAQLRGSTPKFKEADAAPQPGPFPQFASLRPLQLAAATGDEGGPVAGGALRVGVVFGGENLCLAPVNIVAGLAAFLEVSAPGSTILGFQGGPLGFLEGYCQEILPEDARWSMNHACWSVLGGGSCRPGGFSAAERAEEVQQASEVCKAERLDGVIVIAGPRDLSWCAAIASGFAEIGCSTSVVGVPHSKNANLYVPHFMPITLGFDSARRMLSEIAGNIYIDALSSKKYWHFIRCGEDALTMEVALQTRCTASVLTTEESVDLDSAVGEGQSQVSLLATVDRLQAIIERRRVRGRFSGVVLMSRQLMETVPEMVQLKEELLEILGDAETLARTKPPMPHEVEQRLQRESSRELFKRLPRVVRLSLIHKRDAAGMPLLPPDLEGERILGRFVQQALSKVSSVRVAPRFHHMEMTSSAPLPSPFDCALGYCLGHTAGALVRERRHFYVASCANMHKKVDDWEPCAVPFSFLYPTKPAGADAPNAFDIPKRGGTLRRALFEADKHFRETWVENNVFKSPGPVQFGDGGDVGDLADRPFTLLAEYLSLEELLQLIQPVHDLPPPLVIRLKPEVVRDVRVTANLSALEQRRLKYRPQLPEYLRGAVIAQDDDVTPYACAKPEQLTRSLPRTCAIHSARLVPLDELESAGERVAPASPSRDASGGGEAPLSPALSAGDRKPLRIGVVFSSNQVPGMHTAVAGLFDFLSGLSPPAEVIGFLGGYVGLLHNLSVQIDREMVDNYRNLGGEDMLCQFGEPDSLRYAKDLKAVTATLAAAHLDGLVLLGSLEHQVDSAFIAEACAAEKLATRIVGIPVSVDCDFPFVQQTVGHDTTCRTLCSMIGTLGHAAEVDNRWIFMRIVGNSWSHIAVHCTLQTHPSLVLLAGSEYLGQSITNIVNKICDLVIQRHEEGNNYGVVLIPMGFVLDVTEMRMLIFEIMEVQKANVYETSWDSIPDIAAHLKPSTAAVFEHIPRDVQYELCFGGRERQTHKVDLSTLSTERILLRFVEIELERRRRLDLVPHGFFKGVAYPVSHQVRSAIPTDFDCDLAYTLGWGAGQLLRLGRTALLVHASGLEKPVREWRVGGIPFTSLLQMEVSPETAENRISAAVSHLLKNGIERPFQWLPEPKDRSTIHHGPLQFWGPTAQRVSRTTWHLESQPLQDPTRLLRDVSALCSELQSTAAQAKTESTLFTVNSLLNNALSVLESFKQLADSSKDQRESLSDMPIEQRPQVRKMKVVTSEANMAP